MSIVKPYPQDVIIYLKCNWNKFPE